MTTHTSPRMAVEAHWSGHLLRAWEPTPAEVAQHGPRLAAWYNEPHNRAMLCNTCELSPADIEECWVDMWAASGRPFLLSCDGDLIGDADFRHFHEGSAEFAILVGPREAQGKGFGVHFAQVLHALAFADFGVVRLLASVIPGNAASLRMFEKLGYVRDDGIEARAFADEPDDVVLVVDRPRFETARSLAAAEIRWTPLTIF